MKSTEVLLICLQGFTNAPMLDVDGEVLNYEKALEWAERINHEKQ